MTTQDKFFETATDQVTRHVDQVVGMMTFWQNQSQKAMDLWMDQSAVAVKEGQKLMKDWMTTSNKATNDFCKAVETNLKEAVRLYTPETSKSAKA